MENGLPFPDLDPVFPPSVVEPRLAYHSEADLAPDGLNPADKIVEVLPVFLDRHEIRYFGNTLLGKKTGQEDIRIRQVDLFLPGAIENGSDAEPSSFFVVEDRGEDRGGIEMGEAHEVDRPVHSDESDRFQISDDPVILDWLVIHPLPFRASTSLEIAGYCKWIPATAPMRG